MKYQSELKIAIFVLSGFFLLVFGWMYLREFTIQNQTKFIVEYDDVAGLKKGSFIHVNGLRVGRVDGLSLDTKKNKVLVLARIQLSDILIPEDSKIIIRTSGYVGDKYLDIELGMSGSYIADGDYIVGEAAFDSFKSLDRLSLVVNELDPEALGKSIQEFATRSAEFIKKADNLAANTNNVVTSFPRGEGLNTLVSEAKSTAEKLNSAISKAERLASRAEGIIKDSESLDNINSLITNARETSKELNQVALNANKFADNKAAFDRANQVVSKASKAIEDLDEIRQDPLIKNELKLTLENSNLAAKKLANASDDVSTALHQRFLFPKLWFGRVLKKEKAE